MDKKKDPLELILNGEVIKKTFTTKRGKFTLALPLPRDIREIEVEVASRMQGLPASAFQLDSVANFRAYATLDRVVVEAPQWWEDLESSEDCPDDELITDLYRRYLRFYKETQREISNSKYRGGPKVGKVRNKNEIVGDESLSDTTNGSENQ